MAENGFTPAGLPLGTFCMVMASDVNGGTSKKGAKPWNSNEDILLLERLIRIKRVKIGVILGRKAYDAWGTNKANLMGLHKVVIVSKTLKNPPIAPHVIFDLANSLWKALQICSDSGCQYTYVIGGKSLFEAGITDYAYLCERIYYTRFKIDYGCDQGIQVPDLCKYMGRDIPAIYNTHISYLFYPSTKVKHHEVAYVTLLSKLVSSDEVYDDKIVKMAENLSFNFSDGAVLICTDEFNVTATHNKVLNLIDSFGKTANRATHIKQIKRNGCLDTFQTFLRGEYLDALAFTGSVNILTELPELLGFYTMLSYILAKNAELKLRQLSILLGEIYVKITDIDTAKFRLTQVIKPYIKLSEEGNPLPREVL